MLKEFLQESDGSGSAIRLIMYIVVLTFLANWTFFNIKSGTMQPFPVDALLAMASAIALKVGQKPFEAKADTGATTK
jgi:hypothetical protein